MAHWGIFSFRVYYCLRPAVLASVGLLAWQTLICSRGLAAHEETASGGAHLASLVDPSAVQVKIPFEAWGQGRIAEATGEGAVVPPVRRERPVTPPEEPAASEKPPSAPEAAGHPLAEPKVPSSKKLQPGTPDSVPGGGGAVTAAKAQERPVPSGDFFEPLRYWLDRANREYQGTVVRRLSRPNPAQIEEAEKKKQAEERDKAEAVAKAEASRKAEVLKQAEAQKKAAEEAAKAETAKKAEAAKQDEAKKAEIAKEQAEALRKAEEAKKAEIEAQREAEARKQAQEQGAARAASDAQKLKEAERLAEERRLEEQKRLEAERRQAAQKAAEKAAERAAAAAAATAAQAQRRADADARAEAEAKRVREAAEQQRERVVEPTPQGEARHRRWSVTISTEPITGPSGRTSQEPGTRTAHERAREDGVLVAVSRVRPSPTMRLGAGVPRGTAVKRWIMRSRSCRYAGRRIVPPARYTVARGDSLWRISEIHYDNGRRYPRIYRANRDRIGDPNLIYPCQRFLVPRR